MPDGADGQAEVATTAFWSYVRRDNEIVFNKIDHLRQDLCNLYLFETGRTLEIFHDRSGIGWGQPWEATLSSWVGQAMFMMPIVTASYFTSDMCRNELLTFSSRCTASRLRDDLVLPIVLSGAALISSDSDDEVARIIAGSQLEDFTAVWPMSRGGEHWTLAVRQLVHKLIAAEARAADQLSALDGRDAPGGPRFDRRGAGGPSPVEVSAVVSALEPALQGAVASLGVAVTALDRLAAVLRTALLGLTGAGAPAADLRRGLAAESGRLQGPASEFEAASAAALQRVFHADVLISALRRTYGEVRDAQVSHPDVASLAKSLGDLSAVREVEQVIGPLLSQIAEVERVSVVLRRDLRPARRGFQFLRDAARLVLDWGGDELVIDA